MSQHWKWASLVTGCSLLLIAAGCGSDDTDGSGETGEENVADEMDYTIVGIDPGAGIMEYTEQAFEDYDLDEWELQSSSETAMIAELEEAIDNEEPIVVTGWNPHWKFNTHDLKYLDDPELSFGEPEDIHKLVREGLQEDLPEAYEVLNNFEWTIDDIEEIMDELNEGVDEIEAAQNWIDENEDKVSSWTEGIDEVEGDTIELVHTDWFDLLASVNVMALVLDEIGYDVEMTLVEASYMFPAIANGDADAMTGAWLPRTHGTYYEQVEDEVDDLGPHLEGEAAIGLVVPDYMDVDSIEDLEE